VTGESSGEIPLLSFVKDSVHGPVLEEELPERTVVLGIGNVLLSDEGVGVHAIKALAQRYEETKQVEIVDGGTAGMELLPLLEGAHHLIVVDAIRCGQPPASIVRLEGEQVPAYFKTKLSPHQVGLSDVLAALAFKGTIPGQVVLIGVQPVKLSLGMDLSPEVNARLEEVVSMVRAELAKLQCRPAISQNLR
jgi:hydrogenase maturation protease